MRLAHLGINPRRYLKKTSKSKEHLQVVVLGDNFGFPHGMAASNRVRLIARGLIDSGVSVRVLHTMVTERPGHVNNPYSRGVFDNIPYEYTSGTTIRDNRFLLRRWNEIKGSINALMIILKLWYRHEIDCLLLYSPWQSLISVGLLFQLLAKVLRVPIVAVLVEWPFISKNNLDLKLRDLLVRRLLRAADGVITISKFLTNWCLQETSAQKRPIQVLEMPVLIDIKEFKLKSHVSNSTMVLFAGSPEYKDTICFVLDSMKYVWREKPDVKLIITGFSLLDARGKWLGKEVDTRSLLGRIEVLGYLPRDELLALYQKSSALLIPLFDDVKSRARFPTKLAEYLASGRPVVTNSVGEIPIYLHDNINAYICPPGNEKAFSLKIMQALHEPAAAKKVGLAGRQVARKEFHYEVFCFPLSKFISSFSDRIHSL